MGLTIAGNFLQRKHDEDAVYAREHFCITKPVERLRKKNKKWGICEMLKRAVEECDVDELKARPFYVNLSDRSSRMFGTGSRHGMIEDTNTQWIYTAVLRA